MYCKWRYSFRRYFKRRVLIVAKCIVNTFKHSGIQQENKVLIVAKCIVNETIDGNDVGDLGGINSSKVYCKSSSITKVVEKTTVLIVAKCIVNDG